VVNLVRVCPKNIYFTVYGWLVQTFQFGCQKLESENFEYAEGSKIGFFAFNFLFRDIFLKSR
jgi:hypothetical protein